MHLFQLAVDARAAATHPATRNHLLAALPAADFHRLEPDLEPVALPLGLSVYESGKLMDHVFFPTSGIVSLLYLLADGSSAEFALTGNEGLVGTNMFMGGDSTPSRAVVVCAGHAYRLKKRVLMQEFERGGDLQHLLLRYTQALLTQISQNAVCNRHHSVDQQLCRWLLLSLDRQSSNELRMTQELISHMLGVRREGVTEAAGRLQRAGLIRYHRGTITVLDRPSLEHRACECYAVVKKEADRLSSWNPAPRARQAARWAGGAFLTT
jgi:CRP-like cAMP-binding protein